MNALDVIGEELFKYFPTTANQQYYLGITVTIGFHPIIRRTCGIDFSEFSGENLATLAKSPLWCPCLAQKIMVGKKKEIIKRNMKI